MYPGPWKLNNIEASDFCEFSCTQGHESWIKLKRLIFVNFYVTGVMKVEENQSVWFLWIFKYMGSWKLNKINASDFCEFSCTRGHESWRNRSVWFLWIFMYLGSWKLKKIEAFDFCEFSCTVMKVETDFTNNRDTFFLMTSNFIAQEVLAGKKTKLTSPNFLGKYHQNECFSFWFYFGVRLWKVFKSCQHSELHTHIHKLVWVTDDGRFMAISQILYDHIWDIYLLDIFPRIWDSQC